MVVIVCPSMDGEENTMVVPSVIVVDNRSMRWKDKRTMHRGEEESGDCGANNI